MPKQAAAALADPATAFEPAMIVYGLDEAKKAHASVFAADEVELATKAAALMGMVALPVTSDACRTLALGLARGKIFKSGSGFVPFTKMAAFEALKALGGEVPPLPDPPPADPFDAMVAIALPATSWDNIAVGELVLAPEEDAAGGGWWPALVVELRLEQLAVLRWRDWPDLAPFPRRVADLGLLHATAVTADDAKLSCAGDPAKTSSEANQTATRHLLKLPLEVVVVPTTAEHLTARAGALAERLPVTQRALGLPSATEAASGAYKGFGDAVIASGLHSSGSTAGPNS